MNIVNAKILQDEELDHVNVKIMEGIGHALLKESMTYINEIVESAFKSVNPDLKYHGLRRLTADETYEALYRNKRIAYNYDISKSTTYICKLDITWKGESVPNRYIWLLYSKKGGFVYLSNNKYSLIPVVSDKIISVDKNKIFLRLMIDKLTIESEEMNVRINGKVMPILLIKNVILRVTKRKLENKIGNVPIPTLFYSLIKYGYKNTVKRMCGKYIDIDIVTGDVDPSKKQTVYQNITTPYKRYKYKHLFEYRDIKMVVNSKRRIASVDVIASSMLYIFNMFSIRDTVSKQPLRLIDDLLEAIETGDLESEVLIYKSMLGFLTFKDNYNIDRSLAEINEHFKVIEAYVDSVVIKILKTNDVRIDNIFDLYEYVLTNFVKLTSDSISYNMNIKNGYLDILYYIYYNNIVGINTVIRNINNSKRELGVKDVESIFNKYMKAKAVCSLHKSAPLALKSVDYTGDNYYVKITKDIAYQAQGNSTSRSNKPFIKPLQSIAGTDVVTGDIYSLQKKCPSPRVNLNMFSDIDINTNKFILTEEDIRVADTLQRMYDGKMEINEVPSELNTGEIEQL